MWPFNSDPVVHRYRDRKLIYQQGGNRGFQLGDLGRHALVELDIEDTIDSHAVPFAMTFYVLSGAGVCNVDGKGLTMAPGDVLAVEPRVVRSWRNLGEKPLRVLCVRSPEDTKR